AGIGILGVAVGAIMLQFKEAMLRMQDKAGALQAQQANISRAVLEATNEVNWYGYGASVLLALLLIVAGIGLLKRKRAGLLWSNVYAWTSVTTKIGNILLFYLMVIPRLDKALADLNLSSPESKMMASLMRNSTVASGILIPVLCCIYPVLVLILLNRESVRKSLI
ncbi:MAG: hypothetical protein CFE26_03425, partial [Verrucomicrobiales bacterium VVV1]